MYKRANFNAVDTIIACIKERLGKPGLKARQNLEKLLTDATYGRECVLNIYHQDVTAIKLEAQLESLKTYFDEKEGTILVNIIEKIRKLLKSS